ncbi:MAG TPA: zf-HC2 domain-containing protein [Steroidobacteraceae bacterium]|jgi:hypothetical protein
MDHMRFKSNLTAASYVARGLDESTQEDFELHLMSCPECVDDVEAWRAIEKHMPKAERAVVARAAPAHASLKRWRLAASLVGIGIVGAASGWYWRGFADPDLDKTEFFNTLPLTRGAYCTPLKYAADTQRVVLRVAGVASDRKVVALAPQGEALAARSYSARRQTDGSWLLQFAAASLTPRAIRLESQGTTGPSEPLGCISAQSAP